MNNLTVHDTLLRWIDEAEYLAQLNIAQGTYRDAQRHMRTVCMPRSLGSWLTS